MAGPLPVGLMDNCCGCGAPGNPTASMWAQFFWPGFPAFTDPMDSTSTVGVRYLNLTVNGYWQDQLNGNKVKFSYTIRSDQLNSSFIGDPVTGNQPPDYNHFWALVSPGVTFDPALAVVTQNSITFPSDPDTSIVLSSPIPLSFCKAGAQNIMFLVGGVDSVPRGHWRRSLWKQGPETRLSRAPNSFNANWITISVQSMAGNPNFPQVPSHIPPDPASGFPGFDGLVDQIIMCWADAGPTSSGQITVRVHLNPDGSPSDYWEPFPFASNPRAIETDEDTDPNAAAEFYRQAADWNIIQYKYFDVVSPFCVTRQSLDQNFQQISVACAIQNEDPNSNGTIKLSADDLPPDVTQNTRTNTASGVQGWVLTNGTDCPCIAPPP